MCNSIGSKEVNQKVGNSNTQQKSSQSTFVPFIEKKLIDLDTTTVDFDDTTIEHDELMSELEVLRKKVAEEDVKCICLEKEKEKATINALLEREALMRRNATLQEHNRRLEDSSTTLDKDLFGDIPIMQATIKECERALRKEDGLVIAQVRPHEPIFEDKVVSNNVEPISKVVDKGIEKVPLNNLVFSNFELKEEVSQLVLWYRGLFIDKG